MRKRLLLVIIFIYLIGACSSKTQVHLFTTHLSTRNIELILKNLDGNLFVLHVNKQDFPQEISRNSLIYVPSENSHTRIDSMLTSLATLGYEISSTSLLAQGNHSYSANNIGLYLFPKNYVAKTPKYKVALINQYGAIDCQHTTTLTLKADNTFIIELDIWHQQQEEYMLKSYQGKWLKINQTIELTSDDWSKALRFTRTTSEHNHQHGRSHIVSLKPLSKIKNKKLNLLNCTYTINLAL